MDDIERAARMVEFSPTVGEPLEAAQILEAMAGRCRGLSIEVVPTIGSTNDELAARARASELHAHALLAEEQTAGRGRQGKHWVSPRASNVYFTLAWQFDLEPHQLAGLSLAAGSAIADALECGLYMAPLGVRVQLKWPNDLYLNDKKFGGVLVDIVTSPASRLTALIGVGINVAMPASPEERIDQPFCDLTAEMGQSVSRNTVAGLALGALVDLLTHWPEDGFNAWHERWQSRDWLRGKRVRVSGAQQLLGTAVGVSKTGALRIEADGEVKELWAGEISVRPESVVGNGG